MSSKGTDFIFPPRIIPELRNLRGDKWSNLIEQLVRSKPESPPRIAFVLMMVRLAGCTTCQADSFKAIRGCNLCAVQTIKRFKGDDEDLLQQVRDAEQEVVNYYSL